MSHGTYTETRRYISLITGRVFIANKRWDTGDWDVTAVGTKYTVKAGDFDRWERGTLEIGERIF